MKKSAARKRHDSFEEETFVSPESSDLYSEDLLKSRLRSTTALSEEADDDGTALVSAEFRDLLDSDEEEEVEEVTLVEPSEEVASGDEWEGSHPAEVAARTQVDPEYRGPVGGSDEQILRDLRRLVFSVPLLPQKDVHRLFQEIDSEVFPMVYSILDVSEAYLESLFQVIIKVAAGNTYGKNIYEREDLSDEDKEKAKSALKGTFKEHEIKFLKNSYTTFKLFAQQASEDGQTNPQEIATAISKCAFIRGVYEDVLSDFVEKTKYYEKLHWMALKAKLSGDNDEYHRLVELVKTVDGQLALTRSAFAVARDAAKVYDGYTQKRSVIIAPYLRTVYSAARSTARNAHQMLDNFQNGSIGLMRAVSCYSTLRSASFASVAKWWIKQMILLSIKEDANFVKLPVSTWQAYTQLEKAKARIGVDDDHIDKIAAAAKMSVKKAKSVYHTIRIAQVYSLNRTYDSEEKLTLEDIMTDEDKIGHEGEDFTALLIEFCSKADLTDLELKVLALRHGMLDLVPNKGLEQPHRIQEAVIQNLAALGFNYKVASRES